ncbi:MAG: F0F1 ATP synthase subunit A [Clostridiales bacterium]|nr:F0F1 ATP synthase subunit A [Clostridiales bacterium]
MKKKKKNPLTSSKKIRLEKKQKRGTLILLAIALVCLVGSFLAERPEKTETIQEVMQDGVLHETGMVSIFGVLEVNPSFLSAMIITAAILIFAACVRIFVIPRFTYVPGRFQLLLEQWVGFFDGVAESNSPHRHKFLSVYIFGAGSYIFIGTMFELLGLQWVSTAGTSITLPAPLSDINAAIAMGCLSYGVIMSGGIVGNRLKGVGLTLKDFSLPISMSFRLFGALLSGLLVTELVYYYLQLSFILPVIVGILFTVLHALIQTYVLVMLTALFYGEVSEPRPKKEKKKKMAKSRIVRKQANA